MAVETYQFLNEAGVQKLATELLGKVNLRIGERIVTEVSATSSDKVVPSAKTVYDLLAAINEGSTQLAGRIDAQDETIADHATRVGNLETSQGEQDTKIGELESGLDTLSQTVESLTHLTIETVTGSIETVTEPAADKLYLQRDDENDKTWMLYVYNNGSWINVGDTEVDLSGYWAKGDEEAMREALGIHDAEAIPDANITSSVEAAFTATAVTL